MGTTSNRPEPWGLVGLFGIDVVASLFGSMRAVSRLV
jgi:uncharacterized membrane protein YuzA (DUF378 family)